MTNPTLIAQDTAWAGWTRTELQEQLLASRGLTLDATTGRTEATTAEQTDSLTAIYRALNLLTAEFPSLWVRRSYSVAWTSGDHSIALPANVMAILAVRFNGLELTPLDRDSWQRLLRSDDEGGDVADSQDPTYYRVSGFSDEDAGVDAGDRDWRVVLRLHPVPNTNDDLEVEYIALSVDVSTAADPISLFPFLQGWVLERAKEIWAAQNGDAAQAGTSEKERLKHERAINNWIESGTRESSSRVTWKYPVRSRRRRGSRY